MRATTRGRRTSAVGVRVKVGAPVRVRVRVRDRGRHGLLGTRSGSGLELEHDQFLIG